MLQQREGSPHKTDARNYREEERAAILFTGVAEWLAFAAARLRLFRRDVEDAGGTDFLKCGASSSRPPLRFAIFFASVLPRGNCCSFSTEISFFSHSPLICMYV